MASLLLPSKKQYAYVGEDNYETIGNEFLSYFIKLGRLKPSDMVLDVGCGIGRMAVPLTGYLRSGKYYGFDIVKEGIDWCKKNISAKYPNFYFTHVNILNHFYNPNGLLLASKFKYPYKNNYFDFAFLTSVFTHMLPGDTNNYVSELARVLKPGGRILISCFLINKESLKCINENLSSQRFMYKYDSYWTTDIYYHEAEVGYDEAFFRKVLSNNGLESEGIYYGVWCGRKKFLSYQDMFIVRKKS